MNRGLKITLIVVGSLAVAGGITFAIVKSIRKRKENKEAQEKELRETQQLEEINTGLEGQQSTKDNKITPVRNLDKVINNSFSEIRGVKLYPASKTNDPILGHPYAEGYTNVRTSPEVNNKSAWYDLNTNLLGKIPSGASIGTIVSEQYDDMTPKMRWFKVKLNNKKGSTKYGWVRGDTVTFLPFTKKGKKSSFDGAFVQKYDNSYPLGADVFPHPNWMVQYRAYAGDEVTSDFGGNFDLEI